MSRYVGRFAPTPSGPLHLGSLVTATASYVDARAAGGVWRLRIDDLDAPRVVPGATDDILRALDAHGLHWDGAVVYQSENIERHRAALDDLSRQSLCYRCRCSRRELRGQRVYPGTCRRRRLPDGVAAAMRVRVPDGEVAFQDRRQGRHAQRLAADVGDFVVWRRDGRPAYQLAVVVDDAEAGVTDVVRGADLLDNTPRQRFLMARLGLPAPRHLHVPVVAGRGGVKLSKSSAATAILAASPARNAANLRIALELLGQAAPAIDQPEELLAWAAAHWCVDAMPRALTLPNWTSL